MILSLFLMSAIVIALLMSCGFIIAQKINDNSIIDILWGLGFILVAIFTLIYTSTYLARQLLITTLVTIWGLRLSLQIGIRKIGKGEDIRYQKWRKEWGDKFLFYSFFKIFMLQGLAMFIISLPIILINSQPSQPQLNLIDYLGLSVWIIGFLFESIGDIQLYRFLKKQTNKGKLMTSGLWHYTRHPNYFGEASMWWGIFICALNLPYGIITIISPALITYLLLFVSGIPMTEKLMENNPQFEEYKKRTNAFLPWFPKK